METPPVLLAPHMTKEDAVNTVVAAFMQQILSRWSKPDTIVAELTQQALSRWSKPVQGKGFSTSMHVSVTKHVESPLDVFEILGAAQKCIVRIIVDLLSLYRDTVRDVKVQVSHSVKIYMMYPAAGLDVGPWLIDVSWVQSPPPT